MPSSPARDVAVALARAGAWVVALTVLAAGAFAYRPVLVTGASMCPAIEPGDVCIVRLGGGADPGDVVLLEWDGVRPVVHRVVGAGGGVYVTRGDANTAADPRRASAREIRGTVVARVPTGAFARWWISLIRGATLDNQSHS